MHARSNLRLLGRGVGDIIVTVCDGGGGGFQNSLNLHDVIYERLSGNISKHNGARLQCSVCTNTVALKAGMLQWLRKKML